jgi:putative restriction endonuclease
MFTERLQRVRLGQRGFQTAVFNAYHRRCAITGAKIWPALQAAHIRPVAEGGEHRPRLRDEFGNGDQFYAKAGQVIALPDRKPDRPHREFLQWHFDTVYKAS